MMRGHRPAGRIILCLALTQSGHTPLTGDGRPRRVMVAILGVATALVLEIPVVLVDVDYCHPKY